MSRRTPSVLEAILRQVTPDFGNPAGAFQGILSAIMPLGAVIGLPFIPLINDNFGRRWCVMFGSVLMIIGSLLQGFSINGKS